MSETTFATALDSLGTLLSADPGRDAIHLATYAVEAGEKLFPGQHIGIEGGKATAKTTKLLGIVDPFLPAGVNPGQMFWLVLYPRTITSLRHVWDHPAFSPTAILPVSPTSAVENDGKSYSEEWMRRWANQHMSEDYYGNDGRLSPDAAYAGAIEAGHEHHIGPYEDARDHINDEWWDHWEAITGKIGKRGEYFSCAC